MIPFLLAAVGGYLIGDSMGSEKFSDGGTMWRVSPSTAEEDMQEAKELLGEEKWNSFTESEKNDVVEYLKLQGKIGLPGQEEDIEDISALQYYANGGSTGNFAFNVGDKIMLKQITDRGYKKFPFVIVDRLKRKQSDGKLAYFYYVSEEGDDFKMIWDEQKIISEGNKPTTKKIKK